MARPEQPSAQHASASPDLAGLMPPSDLEHLSKYLSEHILHELALVLAGCELPVRQAILRVLREQAEAFGDRVLILALARVGYAADRPAPDASEASG